MPRMYETFTAWGKKKQADIATANVVGDVWTMPKLNAEFIGPKLVTEDDRDEYGKGNEFVNQVFLVNWDVAGRLEKYASSEFMAWAAAFGLGKSVKSGTTPNFTYTCTPMDPATDGEELPYFSVIEQCQPGGSPTIDRMSIGCVVEGFTYTFASGPGRASSKLVVDIVGSGKWITPSAITIPQATAQHLLPSASLGVSVIGVDYVALKDIISGEFSWKNNVLLGPGFFPGSGVQDGAAIRGRMEIGKRELDLKITARLNSGSTELAKLKAQTSGTAVISAQNSANDNFTATFQKVTISALDEVDSEGKVAVTITLAPAWHSTNGLFTMVCDCTTDEIGE